MYYVLASMLLQPAGAFMSLVSSSVFSLKRAHQELEKAFVSGDWVAVRHWDKVLAEALRVACNDTSNDLPHIIGQLEKILNSYARMVSALPDACLTRPH
tara:strand:+ start:738 stop:1034 length:297 start_codon:yes stop_codon:yes gene_type:complete